jgi:poly(3-hydroxybutyrate) depolymerase
VHVAFHGCEQNRAAIGDAFIRGSGFARWADANRLIVLFPQTKRSTVNPKACWDWWGYTGLNYRERSAPQIAAVRAMLDRLAQEP